LGADTITFSHRIKVSTDPGAVHRQLTLYDDSRSRLTDLVRHNMMILRRLPT
jgi:hypothetical protein